jgi:hypothetical protein
MMVAKISTEHKIELDRMEEEFNKEIIQLNESEKLLRDALESKSVEVTDVKKKLAE